MWGKTEGESAGYAKGKVAALLAILEARGLAVDVVSRERIEGCTEMATLDRWLAKAVAASSTEEVIAPDAVR